MIALDTNILIDLMVESMPGHKTVTARLREITDPLCTTPTNIGECVRLLTHPKVFPNPLKLTAAVSLLQGLFDYYQIRILDEDIDWWKALAEMEKEIPGLKGNEIFDARIALCLRSHNIKRIYTRDADFKKYSFLKILKL